MKKWEEKEPRELSWPTKEPRARTEWDFRPLWKGCDQRQFPFEFLPPEDVWYCHWYEFDRTLPRVVENVLEWRGKSPAQTLDAFLEYHKQTHGGDKIVSNWFYMVWPQWPEHPYLSICRTARNQQFDAMWPKEKRRPRALRALSLKEIYTALNTDIYKCNEHIRHILRPFAGEKPTYDGKTITIKRKNREDGKDYAQVIAAFHIDFSMSATRLARLFENWCREQMRINGWKEKPNRGQNSDTDRLRTELKYLGVWRLVQSGLTYRKAADYTKKVSGQPLFTDKAEWSRAVKAAEELLSQYS